MTTLRVRRVGNSNVVSLPRATGLVEGDEVDVQIEADGIVQLRRTSGPASVVEQLRWLRPHLVTYSRMLAWLREH